MWFSIRNFTSISFWGPDDLPAQDHAQPSQDHAQGQSQDHAQG